MEKKEETKSNEVKTEKAIYRKWWFIVGIIVIIIAIIVGVLLLVNNSSTNNSKNSSNNNFLNNELKAKDLSIDDFEWNVEKVRKNGVEAYSLSITNNSEYPIFGIQFDYKTKDTVTEEELDVYTDFMKEHYTYIKENDSARDVIIRADGEKLIKNGETFDEMYFTVGFQRWSWYDYPTDEQFNLMEPKELQLGIIGKDNVAYVAYYDFEKNEWLLDEEAKEINTWPNNELAKKIGKPNLDYYFLDSDLDEEDIEFYVYGITQDVYKSYAESLKNIGFNIDVSEDDSDFEAYDKQGNELSISYYEEKEKMVVDIYFNEESTFVEEVSEDNSYIPETITNTEVNTSANINTNTSESSDLVDGMRPQFKAAMDSYETFMTEYCNFMKKYLDSDGSDLSLMTDYAEYMKKYAEFVKDFEAWEDDTEMNVAETNYYIDVQARVSKKLLEVSQ